ncbi:MAG: hypothetical protein AB7Q01_08175 [Gammaproteobacteria bacterium]
MGDSKSHMTHPSPPKNTWKDEPEMSPSDDGGDRDSMDSARTAQGIVKDSDYHPRMSITGGGVVHVRSSEIIKTAEAKKQVIALKKLMQKGLVESG